MLLFAEINPVTLTQADVAYIRFVRLLLACLLLISKQASKQARACTTTVQYLSTRGSCAYGFCRLTSVVAPAPAHAVDVVRKRDRYIRLFEQGHTGLGEGSSGFVQFLHGGFCHDSLTIRPSAFGQVEVHPFGHIVCCTNDGSRTGKLRPQAARGKK